MIVKGFFKSNRGRLADALNGEPVVVSAHTRTQALADAAYPFIQESNFWWLTGITESDWKLVMYKDRSYLVAPHVSDTRQLFDGGLKADEAVLISDADAVLTENEFEDLLKEIANDTTYIYAIEEGPHAHGYEFTLNPAPEALLKKLKQSSLAIRDCRSELARLRALKQPEEIEQIIGAITASVTGFNVLKSSLPSIHHEYELEAILNSEFRRTGAGGHAYDPIVAGGANACTLHYSHNNDALPTSGLVLVDAGAKVNGYAADITRTYAIGTPSAREVAVHKAVETAHHKIIQLIYPGVKFADYQASVDEIMKDALQEVALLKDRSDEKTYRKYFPHAISHGLGLDVHESLGGFGEFKPGMVLTVEPGIYIPEEGIGVRIEDDILVTETGHKNLSADLPTAL